MIKFRMMCVQPMRLNQDVYSKVISNINYIDVMDSFVEKDGFGIQWLDNFKDKYRKFRSLKAIKLPSEMPSFDLLVKDLALPSFLVGGQFSLSTFVDCASSRIALLYDPRFFSFFIIYELHFTIPENELLLLLNVSTQNTKKDDMYNRLRSLLVKEERHSVISRWGEQLRNSIEEYVKTFIVKIGQSNGTSFLNEKLYTGKIAHIGKNTGNITFFFHTDCNNMKLKTALLNCNAGAEMIYREVTPQMDNQDVCYAFFGRFHTVISEDETYYFRYFPIQFHMQFIWFISGFYLEVLDNLNNEIVSRQNNEFFQTRLDEVDAYVNKIEFLFMYNENFKLTIERDNEYIFNKIEGNWNIEKSLKNARQYIVMFKDYIDRLYVKRQAASESRQNTILFVISCLQVIALLSVWADYLSITNTDSIPTHGPIANIFESMPNLLSFNLWLPVVLGVIIVLLSASTFIRRK